MSFDGGVHVGILPQEIHHLLEDGISVRTKVGRIQVKQDVGLCAAVNSVGDIVQFPLEVHGVHGVGVYVHRVDAQHLVRHFRHLTDDAGLLLADGIGQGEGGAELDAGFFLGRIVIRAHTAVHHGGPQPGNHAETARTDGEHDTEATAQGVLVLVVNVYVKTGVGYVDITGVDIGNQPGGGTEEGIRVNIEEGMAAVVTAGKGHIVEGCVDSVIAQPCTEITGEPLTGVDIHGDSRSVSRRFRGILSQVGGHIETAAHTYEPVQGVFLRLIELCRRLVR